MRTLLAAKTNTVLREEADFFVAKGLTDIPRSYFPLILRKENDLYIDIRPLLFFDEVCLSAAALAEFMGDPAYPKAYKDLIKELCKEGRISPVDTESVLEENSEFVASFTNPDNSELVDWLFLYRDLRQTMLGMLTGSKRLEVGVPFIEFDGVFANRFTELRNAELLPDTLGNFFFNPGFFYSPLQPDDFEFDDYSLHAARFLLHPFLLHIAANIVLPACLDAELQDWQDFSPAYALEIKQAFGKPEARQLDIFQQLASYRLVAPFVKDVAEVPHILNNHKQIETLRNLVEEVMTTREGEVTPALVAELYHDIMGIQERERKTESYVSLFCTVVGTAVDFMVPLAGTVSTKAAEFGFGRWLTSRRPKKHWYFLFQQSMPPI
jgi:hypothetical protein